MDPRLKDERSTCRRAGKQSVYGLKKKKRCETAAAASARAAVDLKG